MKLTAEQNELVKRLCGIGIDEQNFLPVTLLTGPPGAGKRTIVRAAAEHLGMEFIEVPLLGPAIGIRERLCGTLKEAETSKSPPGELGRSAPTLLFFSGLQNVEADLIQTLHQVLSTRQYVDPSGNRWRLHDDIWIACALTFPVNEPHTVSPEHWLVTAFQARMAVEAPSSEAELMAVCESIAAEQLSKPLIDPAIGTTLMDVVGRIDNLRAVRRWMEWMAGHQTNGRVTVETLQDAMAEDLSWILPKIQYRGQELTIGGFQAWARQFPKSIQTAAVQIVRDIADRYYIGTTQYFEGLDGLIGRSGISRKETVAFCKWQHLGKSASRVAHDLQNQGRWRVTSEIDLDAEENDWPDLGKCSWVIVTDDFVGSGKTMSKLFKSPSAIGRVLKKYPHVKIRILLVAGFEIGLRQVQLAASPYRDRVKLIVSQIFGDEDRCFVPTSRIFPDPRQSEQLRQFCIDVAEEHYPGLPVGMRLGHSEIGALVVFFDTVPNNSLPILWHDEATWIPLFPASGLLKT